MTYQFNTLVEGVTNVDELKERIGHYENLKFKEDEYHIIVYSDSNLRTECDIDNSFKSVIIDKETLVPITTQFDKLIYNDEAVKYLSDKDWTNVTIKYCYEGTMIIVFYSHEKWYVCTRKCLDASKSFWIKDHSYYELFMDAINGKFTLDELDKNYYYSFVLVHHKNKNIIDYSRLGKEYKNVVMALVTEKTTFNVINDHRIGDKIIYPMSFKFNNVGDVLKELADISDGDKETTQISTEGFIIEHRGNNKLTLLKLQTDIYKYIAESKPNVSNLDAMFLELYQKDKLREFIPFFTDNCGIVVMRINRAMRTMSTEILNLYHNTRSHKNEALYEALPGCYKTALYCIHGEYIQKRTKEVEKPVVENAMMNKKTITVNDVYMCLKKLDGNVLRNMFAERIEMVHNVVFSELLNCGCFDSLLQGRLMNSKKIEKLI